jgi:hypothetical protein
VREDSTVFVVSRRHGIDVHFCSLSEVRCCRQVHFFVRLWRDWDCGTRDSGQGSDWPPTSLWTTVGGWTGSVSSNDNHVGTDENYRVFPVHCTFSIAVHQHCGVLQSYK